MSTKIICRSLDCIFNEGKACVSDEITYDPEEGCLTYEGLEDLINLEDDDDWEDDELLDEDDEELSWEDEKNEELSDKDDFEDHI